MGKIIGLDIGSKHNGVAVFNEDGVLLHTEVCTRERLIACVENQQADEVILVSIEKFVLYPWAAASQSFKEFENVQLIGVVKYILDQKGIPYIEVKAVDSKTVFSKDRLKRMGYTITHDPYDHKKDAISVGLYGLQEIARHKKTRAKKNVKVKV